MLNIRDSAYSGQTLLETGIGFSEFTQKTLPRGGLPFVLRPDGLSGSFFERTSGRASRVQGYGNLYLSPTEWHGRHEMRLGVDLDSIDYHQFISRQPISIVREDGSLARRA